MQSYVTPHIEGKRYTNIGVSGSWAATIFSVKFHFFFYSVTLTHNILNFPRIIDTRILISTLVCPDFVAMLPWTFSSYSLSDRNPVNVKNVVSLVANRNYSAILATNRNYSAILATLHRKYPAILATLQITSYALGV